MAGSLALLFFTTGVGTILGYPALHNLLSQQNQTANSILIKSGSRPGNVQLQII